MIVLQYIRSALFFVWFIVIGVATHILALPALVMPWWASTFAARTWGGLVLWGLKWIAGVDYEVRGNVAAASGRVLVAAKHFSMWETMVMMALLREPAIVMKSTLFRLPFYGWYSRKAEMISVDRDGRSSALKKMVADSERALAKDRPIVIFPEGARRHVGDPPDYKPGVAALYAQLKVPCIPVALDSGVYWKAHRLLKYPGTIVIEFLDPIPPGMRAREFMALLQDRIESETNRLVAEAQAKTHI